MEDQIITNILTKAESEDLDIRDIIGKLIASILDYCAGVTGSNRHRYYIDDQGRLYISYPSYYYAMDREITQDDIVHALDGLDGDSSIEEISQVIVNYFAI